MFDGVKPMFLMPILEPNYVVTQIMRAVKGNKASCWLPLLTWIGPLLRTLLPVWLFDLIGRWLGLTAAMSHFKGRGADWANMSLPASSSPAAAAATAALSPAAVAAPSPVPAPSAEEKKSN